MTELEWGKKDIYNGTGDGSLIMPPRSHYYRQFNAGNWSDLALGCIYSLTSDTEDTITGPNNSEILDSSLTSNLFHFGLAQPNFRERFIGIRTKLNSTSVLATSTDTLTNLVLASGPIDKGSPFTLSFTNNAVTPHFSMIGLRIRKTANSNTSVIKSNVSSILVATDNKAILLAHLASIPEDDPVDSEGSESLIHNLRHFYIRWPFKAFRIKLHCVGVTRFS